MPMLLIYPQSLLLAPPLPPPRVKSVVARDQPPPLCVQIQLVLFLSITAPMHVSMATQTHQNISPPPPSVTNTHFQTLQTPPVMMS